MRQKTGKSIKTEAKIRTRQKLLMYIEIAKTARLKTIYKHESDTK